MWKMLIRCLQTLYKPYEGDIYGIYTKFARILLFYFLELMIVMPVKNPEKTCIFDFFYGYPGDHFVYFPETHQRRFNIN